MDMEELRVYASKQHPYTERGAQQSEGTGRVRAHIIVLNIDCRRGGKRAERDPMDLVPTIREKPHPTPAVDRLRIGQNRDLHVATSWSGSDSAPPTRG